ncbi:hypothetical protein ACE1TF_03465 [Geomicrobium sp. JSM 1781026]|uniref:hypothetical protein n=1 Tax=Geomicrobium sp. JSM 1781026 TaxID=3344580 RepID=UPI0035C168DD
MVAITQFMYVAPFILVLAGFAYVGINEYQTRHLKITGLSLVAVALLSFLIISLTVDSSMAGTWVLALVSGAGIVMTVVGFAKHAIRYKQTA